MSKRFYLASKDIHEGEAVLRGREAHHATRVMRKRIGERLALFDGEGHEYEGIIREILKGEVTISLEKEVKEEKMGLEVTVACALPKRLRMESVIEKLTEIGVRAILPFVTERTVPQWKGEREAGKLLRFRRIAAEAAKQCGASRLPEISKLFSFTELLPLAASFDVSLFLIPQGRPLREALQAKAAKRVILAVGPEGGWSQKEVEAAKREGWRLASLGKSILKVDTACIAAVSIVHYALDSF